MGSWARALAAALLAGACLPAATASAAAGTPTGTAQILAGPVVFGTSSAWTQRASFPSPTRDTEVRVAPAGGPPSSVLSVDDRTRCDFVTAMSASSRLLVVKLTRNTMPSFGSCGFNGYDEYLVLRPGESAMHPYVSPDGCGPASVIDADDDLIAALRYDCTGRELAIFDAVTGATKATLAIDRRRLGNVKLALGGRHVAITLEQGFPASVPQLSLYDWQADKELARLDLRRPDFSSVKDLDGLGIDSDGLTLLRTVNERGASGPPISRWVSPAEPTLHDVPIDTIGYFTGIFDGVVGVTRRDDQQLVVDVRSGAEKLVLGKVGDANVFVGGIAVSAPDTNSIDIDDGRIALERDGLMVNQSFPPPPAQPVVKRPSVKRGLRVVEGVIVAELVPTKRVEVAIVQLAGEAKPGAVAAASAGRCKQVVRKSGRLALLKARKGRCAPTRFLRAAGTSTWRLALERRLPPGRYAIYARAVDVRGRVARLTSKDATIVRVR